MNIDECQQTSPIAIETGAEHNLVVPLVIIIFAEILFALNINKHIEQLE